MMRDLINLVVAPGTPVLVENVEIDEKVQAFHGTPYDIDQFSLKYVGTGEGAQAFGWGLYFAGDEEIAAWYARTLGKADPDEPFSQRAITLDGKTISSRVPEYQLKPIERAAWAFWFAGRDQNEAIRDTEESIKMLPSGHPNQVMDIETLQVLKSTNMHGRVREASPQLYSVEMDFDDADLMIWEKPFTDQPANVQKAFIKAFGGDEEVWQSPTGAVESLDDMGGDNETVRKTLAKIGGKIVTKTELLSLTNNNGRHLYRALSAEFQARKNLKSPGEGDRLASMYLLKNGVPGHKFKDANSRDSDDGHYNYVVYNGKSVTIDPKSRY